jgi:hypothetical protein
MKRMFKMYNEVFNKGWGDLIRLVFVVDGEVVDSCEEDNMDNILIESYEMYKRNCEKFGYDSRFDSLKIDIRYDLVW